MEYRSTSVFQTLKSQKSEVCRGESEVLATVSDKSHRFDIRHIKVLSLCPTEFKITGFHFIYTYISNLTNDLQIECMDYTKEDDYLYFSLQAYFVLFQFARIKK